MTTATLPDLTEATATTTPTPCTGFQRRLRSGDIEPCPHAATWDLIAACEHKDIAGPYCDGHYGSSVAGTSCCVLDHRVVLIAAMPLTG